MRIIGKADPEEGIPDFDDVFREDVSSFLFVWLNLSLSFFFSK